jgi:hypothetical protein
MMDTIGSDMRIYTIGYSAFDMNGFIRALKDYSANCLIDVRFVSSSWAPHFLRGLYSFNSCPREGGNVNSGQDANTKSKFQFLPP